MRRIFLTSSLFLLSHLGFSQTNTYPASGNVGIGTTSPIQLLDVTGSSGAFTATAKVNAILEQDHTNYRGLFFGYDSSGQIGVIAASTNTTPSNLAFWNYSGSAWFEAMRLTSAGYLGIGTTAPSGILSLGNASINRKLLVFDDGSDGSGFGQAASEFRIYGCASGTNHISFGSYTLTSDSFTEAMRLTNTGNLLIGKTSQANTAYILDVAGNARMNSVVVNTTGADFVFAHKYKLMPLTNLGRFVNKNHHLPGIEPAKDMQANGLNLGESQTKLLQKVEELTLYLVQKDQQLNEQSRRLTDETQKNAALEARVQKLETEVEELVKAKQ